MTFNNARTFMCLAAVVLAVKSATAQNASSERLYEAGTDAGMFYLAQYSGLLRITTINKECGYVTTAQVLAQRLPDSRTYALSSAPVGSLPSQQRQYAVEIARSYILGYETGVRTEHDRQSDSQKRFACEIAAAAAGSILSPKQ